MVDRERLLRWMAYGTGARILQAEAKLVEALIVELLGEYTVQIGDLGMVHLLTSTRIRYRAIIEQQHPRPSSAVVPLVVASPTALPIDSASINIVLLPHLIEFLERPQIALHEAHRILTAEGHLIVCGFNPFSLIGLWRWLPRSVVTAHWDGRFISIYRLRQWLEGIGFECIAIRQWFYRPPLANQAMLARMQAIEHYCQRIHFPGAGAYCLLARKRTHALTPIRLQWQRIPRHRRSERLASGYLGKPQRDGGLGEGT